MIKNFWRTLVGLVLFALTLAVVFPDTHQDQGKVIVLIMAAGLCCVLARRDGLRAGEK